MKPNLSAVHQRLGRLKLRGGGIGVLNLANLAAYTVYPGVAQIPADAWLAEPSHSRKRRDCQSKD